MDSLKDIFLREISGYAGEALNGYSYLTISPDQTVFAVVSIAKVRDERIAFADLIVRLVGDKIVIEEDRNSDVLVDALVEAGIPREQIVLAYAGEAVPEPVDNPQSGD